MRQSRRKQDALVVGGSVHSRLALRERLLEQGFHVTIERSESRGVCHLSRHAFAVAFVDLSRAAQPQLLRRRYRWASEAAGTQLHLRKAR